MNDLVLYYMTMIFILIIVLSLPFVQCSPADSTELPRSSTPWVTVAEDPSDNPIAGLSPYWQQRFDSGDAAFEKVHRPADGLGPVYIRQSCASCHASDSKGPAGVQKMVVLDEEGIPDPDSTELRYGNTIRPQTTISGTAGISAPTDIDLAISLRLGPAVFGRGYLEAISDEAIVALERQQQNDGRVSGRINRVPRQAVVATEGLFRTYQPGQTGLIGRFGVKARIATIDDFVADAYVGDMGLTSPYRPAELTNPVGNDDARAGLDITAETVRIVADYVRLLAIPTRRHSEQEWRDGIALLEQMQCTDCHAPSLPTRLDYPIEQLAGIDAWVFSDLLLHDMGDALADGIRDEQATGSEWKTAPLLGLRHLRTYLHDGRATTLHEAITMHKSTNSEANASTDLYLNASSDEQQQLLEFLQKL